MKKTENTVIILSASYIIEMLWIHFPPLDKPHHYVGELVGIKAWYCVSCEIWENILTYDPIQRNFWLISDFTASFSKATFENKKTCDAVTSLYVL